jgi:hypothetical protein
MARILAAQGHKARALAIYEELIAKGGADSELSHEASELRASGDVATAPRPLPTPGELPKLELPPSGDLLETQLVSPRELRVRWRVSEEGKARAEALLGGAGKLTVRVVSIVPDPERVVRSEVTEHGPVEATGEWTVGLSDESVRRFASIGLSDAERFVSIAHAQP